MHLQALKQKERFHLRFWKLNHREKGTINAFRSYKLTSKLCLVYLKVKLQQNRWVYCI